VPNEQTREQRIAAEILQIANERVMSDGTKDDLRKIAAALQDSTPVAASDWELKHVPEAAPITQGRTLFLQNRKTGHAMQFDDQELKDLAEGKLQVIPLAELPARRDSATAAPAQDGDGFTVMAAEEACAAPQATCANCGHINFAHIDSGCVTGGIVCTEQRDSCLTSAPGHTHRCDCKTFAPEPPRAAIHCWCPQFPCEHNPAPSPARQQEAPE
jgi:hypothetical protein